MTRSSPQAPSPAGQVPPEIVCELLKSHGLAAEIDDGFVRVEGSGAKIALLLYDHHAPGSRVSLQLDAVVVLTEGLAVIESCGAFGADMDEAIVDGLHRLSTYSLHQLLSAFFGHTDCDQVIRETWSFAGRDWSAYLGGVNVIDSETPGDDPQTTVPPGFFDCIERLIRKLELPPQPHWVRVYSAAQPGQPRVVEVLFDNEPWPEGEAAIRGLHWQHPRGFHSVRTFFVLTPSGWSPN